VNIVLQGERSVRLSSYYLYQTKATISDYQE